MSKKHLNIRISGRVQGVFFRASAQSEALKLGIRADFRRRTFHKENISVIKKFLKTKKKISKSSKRRTSKAKT